MPAFSQNIVKIGHRQYNPRRNKGFMASENYKCNKGLRLRLLYRDRMKLFFLSSSFSLSSGREESHPPALADPYETVSRHTAPILQPNLTEESVPSEQRVWDWPSQTCGSRVSSRESFSNKNCFPWATSHIVL